VYKGLQVYVYNTSKNQINKVFVYHNDIGMDPGLFTNYGKDLTLDMRTGQSEQFWVEDITDMGYAEANNISVNPSFINPLHLDSNIPVDYSKGNYRLKLNSPLIDKGYYNGSFPEAFPKEDIDGEARPKDGNGDGIPKYDIGFDEVDLDNLPRKTVNVSISGNGSVKYPSDGSKINCPLTTCSYTTYQYDEIVLEATPSSGFSIDSWGGDCSQCSGEKCKILLDTDKNCTISFFISGTPPANTVLKIDPPPSGGVVKSKDTGDILCGSGKTKCSKTLKPNEKITLEAVANTGFTFNTWDGDCLLLCKNPNNNICDITVPKDANQIKCTALFNPSTTNQFSVQINITGKGKVNISYSNKKQTCSKNCKYTVVQGEKVVLEAVAASGYKFKNWAGDCSNLCNTANKCQLTVNGDTGCEVVFEALNVSDDTDAVGSDNPVSSAKGGGGGCSLGSDSPLSLILIILYVILTKKFLNGRKGNENH